MSFFSRFFRKERGPVQKIKKYDPIDGEVFLVLPKHSVWISADRLEQADLPEGEYYVIDLTSPDNVKITIKKV